MKRWLAAMALASAVGCESAHSPSAPQVVLSLSGTAALTGLNQQTGITATLGGVDITSQSIWSSSNPAIAIVSATTGIVTALANGTSNITAFYGGATGTITVQVSLTDPTLRYLSLANPLPDGQIFSNNYYMVCGPAAHGQCDSFAGIVAGGRPPYSFHLETDTKLPVSMYLGTNGLFVGGSNAAGTWAFSICVTDAVGNRACLPTRFTVVDDFSGLWAGTITAPPIKGHEIDCPGGTWNWSARIQVNAPDAPFTVTWTDDIPHYWRSGPSTGPSASYYTGELYFSPADGLWVYGYLYTADRTIASLAWAHPECRPLGPHTAFDNKYQGNWIGRRIGP